MTYGFDNSNSAPQAPQKPRTYNGGGGGYKGGPRKGGGRGMAQSKAANTHLKEGDEFAPMVANSNGLGAFFKGNAYEMKDVLIGLDTRNNTITIKVGGEVVDTNIATKPYTTKKGNQELGFGTPNLHPTKWLFGNIGKTEKGYYIRTRLGNDKKQPEYESKAAPGFAPGATAAPSEVPDTTTQQEADMWT